MKRAASSSSPDYRVDRSKWVDLVALTHRAAAANAPTDLRDLSELALTADACWTMLAPFPLGLVCRILARTAWAYGRQIDPAMRAQLAPVLIASAGLVDVLHQQTAEAPAASAALATTPVADARLPYADA